MKVQFKINAPVQEKLFTGKLRHFQKLIIATNKIFIIPLENEYEPLIVNDPGKVRIFIICKN